MVASRLQRSPALVPAPGPAVTALPSATRSRHRPAAEGTFADQEAALAPQPAPSDKAGSAPARSPDLARNNRAPGAPEGRQPLLRCSDPRFNNRPASEARDAIVSMLSPYLDVSANFIRYAANMRETEIAHAHRMVNQIPFGAQVSQDMDFDSGLWMPVIGLASEANSLFLAARALAEYPAEVCAAARLASKAIAVFQRFSAAFDAAAAETNGALASDASLLATVKDVATATAAVATFIMLSAGVVYFTPTIVAGAANASAVGGTTTAAGKVAVMGGALAGGTRMVGTAMGGGNVDEVGQAGIDGAKSGAVDALAGVSPVPGTLSKAGEVIGGAALGALGSASQAAGAGQSVPPALLFGAVGNVLQTGISTGH